MNKGMHNFILFAMILSAAFIFVEFGDNVVSAFPSSPITVNLSISKIPLINESTNLYCKIDSTLNASNTTAKITLPEGVELVDGSLTGQWDLKTNVPVYLNATIKFSKPGDFTIEATARHQIDSNNFWGGIGRLYLTIGENASFFTPAPSWAFHPAMQITPGQIKMKTENTAFILIDRRTLPPVEKLPIASKNLSRANASLASGIGTNRSFNGVVTTLDNPGDLTVTGHIYYWGQDGDYVRDPDAWLPAKNFLTMICRGTDETILGSGYTDQNGAFSITITNPGNDGFKVEWWTYTDYGNGEELRVVNSEHAGLTGLTGVYAWETGNYTSGDGTTDLGGLGPLPTDTNAAACWLLDDLDRANLYISGYTGGTASQGTIVWWPYYFEDASYTPGGQIHIPGGWEVAPHVAIHEYGHNIMYTKYGKWLPPTPCTTHSLSKSTDVNCAWTEGWADFFALAVTNDSTLQSPDSFAELEWPTWGPSEYGTGPTWEARIAGALWDIMDTHEDGIDIYSWGFGPIADVVFSARENNFADFWSQWQKKGYSSDASHCLWQNTIDPGINLRPNAPAIPTGPSQGQPATSYSYSTSADDPREGDQVKYTFDWGDGTSSTTSSVNSGTSATASKNWSKPGTYQVKATTTDSLGAPSSRRSDSLTVTIDTPPNTPITPSGPVFGLTGTSYSYSTSATDPDGDLVQYTFDWGDGNSSTTNLVNSGTTTSAAHSWSKAGTYQVRAHATDSKGATSGISDPLTVIIDTPPNTPTKPSGPEEGRPRTSYSYSTNATDPDGDQVKYTFDWDDGYSSTTYLVNSGTNASATHEWKSARVYQVRAYATDSKGATSGFSDPLTVAINNDSIGIYRSSNHSFYLDSNNNRFLDSGDVIASFGKGGDLPVTGDWNGDSKDEVGIFRPSTATFYLDTNGNRSLDPKDFSVKFGLMGDLPVIGDWNGDGKDKIGVFRRGTFYLDYNGNRTWGSGNVVASFGRSGDLPVAGDWNGDGKDKIGVFRPDTGVFYLDYNGNRTLDSGDITTSFGMKGDEPVAGDWNGDGKDEIGVLRAGNFYLDYNGDGSLDAGDVIATFGFKSDMPVAGVWS